MLVGVNGRWAMSCGALRINNDFGPELGFESLHFLSSLRNLLFLAQVNGDFIMVIFLVVNLSSTVSVPQPYSRTFLGKIDAEVCFTAIVESIC